MEVNLPRDVETKLARLANQRGVDAQGLARTAIELFVDYDDRFIGEVEKGLSQIDRGEVLTHEVVGTVSKSTSPKSSLALNAASLDRRTEEAATDLENIADYLFEYAPSRAAELVRSIFDAPAATDISASGPCGKREGSANSFCRPLPEIVSNGQAG